MFVIDGNKVRALREAKQPKKLTQLELANKSGIQPSVVSHMENGKKKVINSDSLGELAKVLGVPPGDLLKEVAD